MINSGLLNFMSRTKKLMIAILRQPLYDQWEEYTWLESGQMSRKLAKGLKSLVLRDEAHVGLISRNCRKWVIADLAIMMSGYLSVPFFPSLKGEELELLFYFGDDRTIIYWKNRNLV